MTKQKGFAHALLIIGLIVALIGALSFIFWQNFINDEPSNSVSKTSVAKNDLQPQTKIEDENSGYIVVSEWGIKLKTSAKAHLSYDISSRIGGRENTEVESLGLKIKSTSVTDQSCMDFGADLYRQKVATTELESKKIGDYYYFVTGAPGICSKDPNDISLQKTVLDELRVNNLVEN